MMRLVFSSFGGVVILLLDSALCSEFSCHVNVAYSCPTYILLGVYWLVRSNYLLGLRVNYAKF